MPEHISYAAQVIADASGQWAGNGLRFATREQAQEYVADLAARWTSVTYQRVIETDEPVNVDENGRLTS
jgi:hypothetical protein